MFTRSRVETQATRRVHGFAPVVGRKCSHGAGLGQGDAACARFRPAGGFEVFTRGGVGGWWRGGSRTIVFMTPEEMAETADLGMSVDDSCIRGSVA